jgi:hypothetical protein
MVGILVGILVCILIMVTKNLEKDSGKRIKKLRMELEVVGYMIGIWLA